MQNQVDPQQDFMFNYLDLNEILISISKHLAPPKPLSCPPSCKCTHASRESVILNEEVSMLPAEKPNTNSELLGQCLAYPFPFTQRRGFGRDMAKPRRADISPSLGSSVHRESVDKVK